LPLPQIRIEDNYTNDASHPTRIYSCKFV